MRKYIFGREEIDRMMKESTYNIRFIKNPSLDDIKLALKHNFRILAHIDDELQTEELQKWIFDSGLSIQILSYIKHPIRIIQWDIVDKYSDHIILLNELDYDLQIKYLKNTSHIFVNGVPKCISDKALVESITGNFMINYKYPDKIIREAITTDPKCILKLSQSLIVKYIDFAVSLDPSLSDKLYGNTNNLMVLINQKNYDDITESMVNKYISVHPYDVSKIPNEIYYKYPNLVVSCNIGTFLGERLFSDATEDFKEFLCKNGKIDFKSYLDIKYKLQLIEYSPACISMVKNQTFMMQKIAIEKNPEYIKYISNPYRYIKRKVLEADPKFIQNINPRNQSKKDQAYVILKDPANITYIREPFKDTVDLYLSQLK